MSLIKKSLTAGWNVGGWLGTRNIKNNVGLIKDLASDTFAMPQSERARKESFGQCMRRLGISEADLQKRIKNSGQIILICLLLSIPLVFYTVYIFASGHFLSGFVCLMLSFLLLAQIFREHFNRFQMQQRRLGCTLKEWWQQAFSPRKSS